MKQFAISILTSFHGRRRPWYLTGLAAIYTYSVINNAIGIVEYSWAWPDIPSRRLFLLAISAYLVWGLWTGNKGAAEYLVWWGAALAIFSVLVFVYRVVKYGWSLQELGMFVITGMAVALVVAVRTQAARRFFCA